MPELKIDVSDDWQEERIPIPEYNPNGLITEEDVMALLQDIEEISPEILMALLTISLDEDFLLDEVLPNA